ncbi:MAG: LysM peptidoglycan-binding domain-containing protein [Balneolaceae bacterium]|nr:LysM peptidoglycan-binding domain-containing protein [Balneolaceae bacterium]
MIYRLFSILILSVLFSSAVFAQNRSVHIVKEGETLYSISRTLGVSVAELQAWNELSDNSIAIGQELVYYTEDETLPDPKPLPVDEGQSLISISQPQENAYYMVKSGDNLTTIARAHSMTLSELRALNELQSDVLRIGQRLTVRKVKDSVAPSAQEYFEGNTPQGSFVVYTLSENESLAQILEKFKMTENELRQLNPEVNLNSLNADQRITVLLPPTGNFENPFKAEAGLQNLGSVEARVYQPNEKGNSTSSGELYNPEALTAAHSNITIGSILFVENAATGKGIYVRINDRITSSGLKLSQEAFRILGLGSNAEAFVKIYTNQ